MTQRFNTTTDTQTFVDARIDGAEVVSIDRNGESVVVRVFDPQNPDDSVAEFEFDTPDENRND